MLCWYSVFAKVIEYYQIYVVCDLLPYQCEGCMCKGTIMLCRYDMFSLKNVYSKIISIDDFCHEMGIISYFHWLNISISKYTTTSFGIRIWPYSLPPHGSCNILHVWVGSNILIIRALMAFLLRRSRPHVRIGFLIHHISWRGFLFALHLCTIFQFWLSGGVFALRKP